MSDEARNAPTASPERSVAGASTRITILEVVFAYGLFASAWILFSDSTLRKLIHDPDRLMFASTIKGWVFVGVTSLLLYLLMRRMVQRLGPPARDPAPSLRPFIWIVPLLLAFVGVGAVAAAGALLTYHQEAGKDYARLQAVTELKASQVASWMEERLADSRFLHSSSHWANLFRRVQAGDRASLEQLVTRMEEYRVHHR